MNSRKKIFYLFRCLVAGMMLVGLLAGARAGAAQGADSAVGLAVTRVDYNASRGSYQVDLRVTNPQAIQTLRVSVLDTKSRLIVVVAEYQHIGETLTFSIPADHFSDGDYELRLTPYRADGRPVLNADGKTPFLVYSFKHNAALNGKSAPVTSPLVWGYAHAIATLVLLLIILWLAARLNRIRSMTGIPFLWALLPEALRPGQRKPPGEQLPDEMALNRPGTRPASAPQQTQPAPVADPLQVPKAALRIIASGDPGWVGETYAITRLPFHIGRQGCDLTIENEISISRTHAKITYDERQGAFMITDLSRNGVLLAGTRIPRDTPARLLPGTEIGLGPKTAIRFELKEA